MDQHVRCGQSTWDEWYGWYASVVDGCMVSTSAVGALHLKCGASSDRQRNIRTGPMAGRPHHGDESLTYRAIRSAKARARVPQTVDLTVSTEWVGLTVRLSVCLLECWQWTSAGARLKYAVDDGASSSSVSCLRRDSVSTPRGSTEIAGQDNEGQGTNISLDASVANTFMAVCPDIDCRRHRFSTLTQKLHLYSLSPWPVSQHHVLRIIGFCNVHEVIKFIANE